MRSAAFILLSAAAFAQEFEVASIKPAAAYVYVPRGGPGTTDPTHVNYRSLSMKNLLMAAYDLPIGRISGPAWIDSERYDISASIAPGATKEQLAIMLQNLLADRFHLAVHRETRDMPVFEISLGKNGALGSGLKPYIEGKPAAMQTSLSAPPPGGVMASLTPGRRQVYARKQTMLNLVTLLAAEFGRPVIDKTGLTGDYDYALEYLTQGPAASIGPQAPAAPDALETPSLQSAVQDQLGLHLEAKRGPVEILVVDRGEKTPTEN